jgi:hypothetical protein
MADEPPGLDFRPLHEPNAGRLGQQSASAKQLFVRRGHACGLLAYTYATSSALLKLSIFCISSEHPPKEACSLMTATDVLFRPFPIGALELANRVVRRP